jgi:hypothetical protein
MNERLLELVGQVCLGTEENYAASGDCRAVSIVRYNFVRTFILRTRIFKLPQKFTRIIRFHQLEYIGLCKLPSNDGRKINAFQMVQSAGGLQRALGSLTRLGRGGRCMSIGIAILNFDVSQGILGLFDCNGCHVCSRWVVCLRRTREQGEGNDSRSTFSISTTKLCPSQAYCTATRHGSTLVSHALLHIESMHANHCIARALRLLPRGELSA